MESVNVFTLSISQKWWQGCLLSNFLMQGHKLIRHEIFLQHDNVKTLHTINT